MTKPKQSDNGTTAIRLIKMLSFIPQDGKGVSTSHIKDRLETQGYCLDVRTIQRDLQALSLEFPLESRPEGRTNYWYFRKGSQTLWPAMNPDAALAVMMAEQNLKTLIPTAARRGFDPIITQAKQTLSLQDRSGYNRWLKAMRVIPKGVIARPPPVRPDVINAVYQAIAAQRQLEVTKAGKASVVNPLGMVQRGETVYLVCTYYEYDEIRITALHRIESAKALLSDIRIPKGFDLDTTLNSGIFSWRLDPEHPKSFELDISADAAPYFEENRVNETQSLKALENNRWLVRFNTEDTLELRQWLLGFGAEVIVKKPAAVRKWIVGIANEIADTYKDY